MFAVKSTLCRLHFVVALGYAQVAAADQNPSISGTVVYGLGSNLYSVSLRTGEKRLLLTRSGGSLQDGMTRIDGQRLLIGGSGDLVEYDKVSNSLRTLGQGEFPLALPQRNSVYYYAARKGERVKLFRAALTDLEHSVPEVVEPGPYHSLYPLIAISENEIIFESNDQRAIWRYVTDKSELSKLPFANCTPEAWRSKTNQVLCWNQHSKSHDLVDLTGSTLEHLPELTKSRAIPVLYLEEFDVLLVNVPAGFFPPEKYDLAAFSFSTRRIVTLAHDALVARGTAIWNKE